MKLKYYLRGVGIGLIFAAIVMGIALSKRGRELTDAEIMERARKLGMVEAEGTLTDYAQSFPEGTDEGSAEASGNAGDSISEKTDQKGAQALGKEDEIVVAPLVPQNTEEETDSDQAESDDTEASSDSEDQTGDQEKAGSAPEAESPDQEDRVENTSPESQSGNDAGSQETANTAETDEPAQQKPESDSDFINPTYIEVSIPKGVGSETISAMLERAGLVDNGVLFNRYLIENHLDRIIRSGNRTIPTGITYEQVAKIITSE